MKPLNSNVIIRLPNESENTSSGGIITVGPAPKDRGVVFAVGDKVEEVSVGDVVVFNRSSPHNLFELDHRELYVRIDESYILAKIED